MMHTHSPDGADACFGCKMAYMRQHRSLTVTYAGGQDSWHNDNSVVDRERRAIEANTAAHGAKGFDRADPGLVDRQLRPKPTSNPALREAARKAIA